jgi:hypothetical protein
MISDVDSNTFILLGLRIYGKKSNYVVVNKLAFIFPDKKRAERNCINFVYIFRLHRIGKTKKSQFEILKKVSCKNY